MSLSRIPTPAAAITGSLIRQAARRAPPALAARLEEEWLADLAAQSSPGARLSFALGCCWATCVIAREHATSGAPVAVSSTGVKTMILDMPSSLPRRTGALLAVICLHIGLIYLLATGLASQVVQLMPPRTTVSVYQEPRPARPAPMPPDAPTLRPLKLQDPMITVDPIVIDDSFEQTPTDETPLFTCPPTCSRPVVAPAHAAVVRGPGGLGKGFPSSDDFYPSTAQTLGQQGTTAVHVCVDSAGRLTSAPTLAGASGVASLDAAALRLARAGSGHYSPPTENGQPVGGCYAFRVRFDLRN
jgi:protein TonB